MSDIKQYFSSPTKTVEGVSSNALQPIKSDTKPNAGLAKSVASDSKSVTNSPSSSKLIVSNMSSVISSVEKLQKAKRKEKVLKRKQRESTEPEISDIAEILSSGLHFVSPTANETNEVVPEKTVPSGKT